MATNPYPPEMVKAQQLLNHRIRVFDDLLRKTGIQISLAAHERGFQTDALDKVLESPVRAGVSLYKAAAIIIDKLRLLASTKSELIYDMPEEPIHSILRGRGRKLQRQQERTLGKIKIPESEESTKKVKSTDPDLAPARWFTKNTLISADNLLKAAKAEQIRFEHRTKAQNLYSRIDAKEKWPHLWQKPSTQTRK